MCLVAASVVLSVKRNPEIEANVVVSECSIQYTYTLRVVVY